MPTSSNRLHESNGHFNGHDPRPKSRSLSAGAAHKVGQQTALVKALQKAQIGTDEITIGGSIKVNGQIKTATMADVAKLIASVKYLVRGWIPFSMVTGFIAEPGVGKSAFALWLAFTIMTGRNWFNGTKGPTPSKVLWCPTENDMAITKDRMEKWGIPFDKMVFPFEDDPLRSVDLLNPAHLKRVEQVICKYQTKAAFVDSLRGAHDGDENSSRTGKVLQNMSVIAERTKVAAVVVHHTGKLEEGTAVSANSSRGSNAIIALFRSQLGFDKPDPDSEWVRVRMLKQNLGLAPEPFGLRVTDKGLEFGAAPEKPNDKNTQKAKAVDFLREYLKDRKWHLRNDVVYAAQQNDFSANAIQRAREELGIVYPSSYMRQREDKQMEWRLPPGS